MNATLYYHYLDNLTGGKSGPTASLTSQEILQQLSTFHLSLDTRRAILDCIISRCLYNIDGIVHLIQSTNSVLKPSLLDVVIRNSCDVNKVILLSKLSEAATEDHIALITDALMRICNTEYALHVVDSLRRIIPEATRIVNRVAPTQYEIIDKWNQSKKIFLNDASQLIKSAIDHLLAELSKPIGCDLDGRAATKITRKAFEIACNNANGYFPHTLSDFVDIFHKQVVGDTSLNVTDFVHEITGLASSSCLVRLDIALHCCDAVQSVASTFISLCQAPTLDAISLQRVYCSVLSGIRIVIDILGAKPTASHFTWPWIQIQLWCASVNHTARSLLQLLNIPLTEDETGDDVIFDEKDELDYHEIVMLGSIGRNSVYNTAIRPGALVLLHDHQKSSSNMRSFILNYLAAVCNDSSLLYAAYASSRIVMRALHLGHEHLGICVSQIRNFLQLHKQLGCRIVVSALVLWISESPLKEKNAWSSMSSATCAVLALVSQYVSPFEIFEEALQYICTTSKCVVSLEECCVSQPGLILSAMVFLCTASGELSCDTTIYISDRYHAVLATSMLEWSCALCESCDDVPLVALQQLNAILRTINSSESTSLDMHIARVNKLINKSEANSPRNLDSLTQLKRSHRIQPNDYVSTMRDLISHVHNETDVVRAVCDIHKRGHQNMVSVYQAINTIAYSEHPLAQSMKNYLLPCSQISKLASTGNQSWEFLFHDVYDIRPHLRSAIVCCDLRLLSFLSIDTHHSYVGSMLVVDLGAVTVVTIHALRSLFHCVDQRSSDYQSCLNVVRRNSHVINIKVLQQALQYFIAYMTTAKTMDAVHNASLYAHVCIDIMECAASTEHLNFTANIIDPQMYHALIVHFLQCYGRENDDSVEHLLQIILRLCHLANAKSGSGVFTVAPLWALVSLAHHCDYNCDVKNTSFVADALHEETTGIPTEAMSFGIQNANENISVLYIQRNRNAAQSMTLQLHTDTNSYPYSIHIDVSNLKAVDLSKTHVVEPIVPTLRSLFDALRHVPRGSGIEMVVYYLLRYVYLPLQFNGMIGLLQYVFRETLLADHDERASDFERHASIQLFVLKRLLYEKTPRHHPLLWIFSSLCDAIDVSSQAGDPISMSSIMQFLNNFPVHELQSTVSLAELSRQLKKSKINVGSKYNSFDCEIEAACDACCKFVGHVLSDDGIIKGREQYTQAISFIIVSLVAYVDVSTSTSLCDTINKLTSASIVQLLTKLIHSTNYSLSTRFLKESLREYSLCYSWSAKTIALYKSLFNGSHSVEEEGCVSEENNSVISEETPARDSYISPLGFSPARKSSIVSRGHNIKRERDVVTPVKLEICEDGIPDVPGIGSVASSKKIEKDENQSSKQISVNNMGQKYHISF